MAIQYCRRPTSFDTDPREMNGAASAASDNPDLSEDDDDTSSDMSDGVVEVPSNDFPDYFQERGGRLFHSHGGSPYPLPVDAEEQQVSSW